MSVNRRAVARRDAPVVLLAERDEDTRLMYAAYLRQLMFDVEEAEDGREALAKAIARHPNVVVTETRLPGISGFELCRLLRNDPVARGIPIVVVTGDAFPTDVRLAETVGADAVLVKPCLPEQLLAEISRLLTKDGRTGVAETATAQAAQEASAPAAAGSTPVIQSRRRGRPLSRAHERGETISPPSAPPLLVCPQCDHPLRYVKSHLGGVSERHAEQWDYYECAACGGTFEYRQRTRKMRACQPMACDPSRTR